MTRPPESSAVPVPSERDGELMRLAIRAMSRLHAGDDVLEIKRLFSVARAEGDAAGYARGFADARERIAMQLALLHVKAIDDSAKGSDEDAVAVILYDELRKWVRSLSPGTPREEGRNEG